MVLLPHAHFIFLFAVVGNDRSGSNRLCSSNISGSTESEKEDSLHYLIWDFELLVPWQIQVSMDPFSNDISLIHWCGIFILSGNK